MRKCGIYKITNIANNKVYIGQSVDLDKRIWTHKYELRNNKHDNVYLQNSFIKYGESNFSFEIIELCNECELNKKEYDWIHFYKSCDRLFGYNIQIPNDSQSYIVAEETKEKLRKHNIKVSNEEILDMIVNYFNKYKKVPTLQDFTNEYTGVITGDRVKVRFKGFRNAIEQSNVCDLVTSAVQVDRNFKYSEKLLLKLLKRWIEINGESPSCEDVNSDSNMPSITPYISVFGSLNNAIELLGYNPRRKSRKNIRNIESKGGNN